MHNHHYKKRRRRLPVFLLFFVVMLLLLSAVVMLLWNAILPALVGVKNITYGQAVGLLVLCRILFGGFRFGAPPGRRFGPYNNLREKWMGMSEEDKARFRNEWQKRCKPRQQPPSSDGERKEE
jgi:hypothetical protein